MYSLSHLDNASTDKLLNLVPYLWVLQMILSSLWILLEVYQHLITPKITTRVQHRGKEPIRKHKQAEQLRSRNHTYEPYRKKNPQGIANTCRITGSDKIFWISGSCIAFACHATTTVSNNSQQDTIHNQRGKRKCLLTCLSFSSSGLISPLFVLLICSMHLQKGQGPQISSSTRNKILTAKFAIV